MLPATKYMFVQVAVAMHCAPQAWALKTKGLEEVYAVSKPVPVSATASAETPQTTPYGVGDAIATPAVHYTEMSAYFAKVRKKGE